MSMRCFYCMDYKKVYKDRKTWFDFMDGRGKYDIVNCTVCIGNDNWLKCSGDPEREYPGICQRQVTCFHLQLYSIILNMEHFI